MILNIIQKQFISTIAEESGFVNFKIETVENGLKKGDNYVGQVTAVKVTEEDGSRAFNFILKSAKEHDPLRKQGQASSAFVREARMYDTVLHELLNFQKEENISNPFAGVAKCYAVYLEPPHEFILMENLKSRGYTMWNRRQPMDHEHIALVFKEYAKFHAISFALKHKCPQKYEHLTEDLRSVMGSTEERKKFFDSYKATALKYLKNEELKNALKERWHVIEDYYTQMRNEKFVIQHGDAWCNNMLFKYEKHKPTDLYFVDWQNSKIGSPIWDLVYFFCVCASKEVLYDYQTQLRIYYERLSQALQEFGCDSQHVFSRESFTNQWNKYAKMGLFCMLMVGQILVVEEDDIPDDFDELRKDPSKTLSDILNLSYEGRSLYRSRLSDLLEFLLKENLF